MVKEKDLSSVYIQKVKTSIVSSLAWANAGLLGSAMTTTFSEFNSSSKVIASWAYFVVTFIFTWLLAINIDCVTKCCGSSKKAEDENVAEEVVGEVGVICVQFANLLLKTLSILLALSLSDAAKASFGELADKYDDEKIQLLLTYLYAFIVIIILIKALECFGTSIQDAKKNKADVHGNVSEYVEDKRLAWDLMASCYEKVLAVAMTDVFQETVLYFYTGTDSSSGIAKLFYAGTVTFIVTVVFMYVDRCRCCIPKDPEDSFQEGDYSRTVVGNALSGSMKIIVGLAWLAYVKQALEDIDNSTTEFWFTIGFALVAILVSIVLQLYVSKWLIEKLDQFEHDIERMTGTEEKIDRPSTLLRFFSRLIDTLTGASEVIAGAGMVPAIVIIVEQVNKNDSNDLIGYWVAAGVSLAITSIIAAYLVPCFKEVREVGRSVSQMLEDETAKTETEIEMETKKEERKSNEVLE